MPIAEVWVRDHQHQPHHPCAKIHPLEMRRGAWRREKCINWNVQQKKKIIIYLKRIEIKQNAFKQNHKIYK